MVKSILATLAVGLALVSAAPAVEAKELKMAHFMSPQHPMDRHVMTPLAEAVGKASGGSLTIKVYPAGELGAGPNQQYRRAVTGIADIAFNLPQYTPTQFKRSELLHVPGLFTSPEQATRKIWDNMEALAPDFSEVKLLAYWTNNPSLLFTRDKPVRSMADMKGLKVRVPDPVTAKIVEAWGGIPVSLPATEAYNAMSTGVVDAVMIDASAIASYNLQEVTKYATMNIPGALSTFTLIMNQSSYDGLDDAQKAILDGETGLNLSLQAADAFLKAGEKGVNMLKDAKVELIELDPAALEEFRSTMAAPVDAFLTAEGEAAGFDAGAFISGFKSAN